MSRLISELLYKISADSKEFNKALDQANDRTKTLTDNLNKTGKALSIGLTAPLLAAGAASAKLASDLQDSTNAVNVIFKDGASVILEYGKTAAESAGLSQAAFNDVAAASGVLLAQTGKDLQDVAQDTVNLTQRAADLASLFGGSTVDAANALGAALRGESEPARRYGVLLSEAAIAAKALELGVGDASGALTEAEKIQIRYNLIMDQSATASGDFANTNGDVKNSAEVLKAQIQNLAASLGTELLPIVADVLQDLRGFVSGFTDLDSSSKQAILAFAAVAASIGPMLLGVSKAVTAFNVLKVAMASIGTASAGPIGLAIAGITALTIATISIAGYVKKTRQEQELLNNALSETGNVTYENLVDATAILTRQFNDAVADWQDARRVLNGLAADTNKSVAQLKREGSEYALQLIEEVDKRKEIVDQIQAELETLNEKFERIKEEKRLRDQAEADRQAAFEEEIRAQDELIKREQERREEAIRLEQQLEQSRLAADEDRRIREEDDRITLERINEIEARRQQVSADEFNRRRQIAAEAEAIHQEELARIEAEKQAKIEAAQYIYNQLNSITNKLFDNEIARIEQSSASEKDKARQIAEIKRKQAIFDKARATFEVGINTASAIMRSFEVDPTGLLAIAIGILGGIQAAAILAEPLPQIPSFAQGVRNYMVPDGFPNDSFPIRVQSGERVTVETPQQQATGGGGQVVLHIGTLVADDAGLRELERRMQQVSLGIGG